MKVSNKTRYLTRDLCKFFRAGLFSMGAELDKQGEATKKIKEDWACMIIGQALADIKTKKDIRKVVDVVSRTAVGVRPDLMKQFMGLVKMKEKTL